MTQFSLTIDNYNRLHGTVIAWWLWTILTIPNFRGKFDLAKIQPPLHIHECVPTTNLTNRKNNITGKRVNFIKVRIFTPRHERLGITYRF